MSSAAAASTWLSAPAFFSVLPTVVNTSTPCARAISAVASVQLSATTTTRSGGLRLAPQRLQRRLDGECLVVGGHQHCQPQRRLRGVRSGSLLSGSFGSSTSRAADRPSGASTIPRARRISGESGGGIRRSRANTRIAAAACSAARPTKKAAAAAPTATSSDTPGTSSGPNGSCPTMSLGATRCATHPANTKTLTASANRPTAKDSAGLLVGEAGSLQPAKQAAPFTWRRCREYVCLTRPPEPTPVLNESSARLDAEPGHPTGVTPPPPRARERARILHGYSLSLARSDACSASDWPRA